MTERDLRHRPVPRPWYRKAWFTWLVVIAVAVVFVAILVYPVAAMDDQSYCTSCKAMKPAEKTLAASAHTGIDCTKCHIPPGAVAASKWRLTEAKNVWADYLGMPSTAEKEHTPTNANCLECHPLSGIPDETAGVRMNHAQHLQQRDLLCVDCHDTVSHKLPGQKDGVSMVTCAMCHNEQGAPDACDFCHAAPPASEHAPDFMKEHGKEALVNPEECLRCHHDKTGVLRQVPRLPAVIPLLRAVALHARQGRRGGSRELRGLPRQGLLRAVPPGEPSDRLDPGPRRHRRQGTERLPRVSPKGHV